MKGAAELVLNDANKPHHRFKCVGAAWAIPIDLQQRVAVLHPLQKAPCEGVAAFIGVERIQKDN